MNFNFLYYTTYEILSIWCLDYNLPRMITKSRSLCLELTPDKDFTFILWAYKSNAFLNFWFKFCRSPSREVSGMLMTPLIQMPFRSMLFLTLSNGDEIRWFISESSASWKFFFLISMTWQWKKFVKTEMANIHTTYVTFQILLAHQRL